MTMRELIEEVVSLPVEERAVVADSILHSLNLPSPTCTASGRNWLSVAWPNCAKARGNPCPASRCSPESGSDSKDDLLLPSGGGEGIPRRDFTLHTVLP